MVKRWIFLPAALLITPVEPVCGEAMKPMDPVQAGVLMTPAVAPTGQAGTSAQAEAAPLPSPITAR
jgi:hypothetical protein